MKIMVLNELQYNYRYFISILKVAMNILNSGRFSMGSSGAGVLKKMMGMCLQYKGKKQSDIFY